MKRTYGRWWVYCLVFAMVLTTVNISALASDEEGPSADCEKGLMRCLFAYTILLGPSVAIALCSAGYAWCLQFMI